MRVHQRERLLQTVRPCDTKYPRNAIHQPAFAVGVFLAAQASSNNHTTVFTQGLRDGLQTFGHRRVNEGTGIDDHQIGFLVVGGNNVAFGTQFRHDALGVHQSLGAAQAHKANATDSSFLHSCHCYSLLFDPNDSRVPPGLFAVAAIAEEALCIGNG